MSFVAAVRDYVDLLNANFDSFHQTFGREITLAAVMKGTILYLGQSIKLAFLYLVTFQWLRDLAYVPVLIPEITRDTFLETFGAFGGSASPSNQPFTELGFFGMPTLLQNKFVVGFLNSFFASLPFTFAHLLSLRQFYITGWRSAAATNAGMIIGHTLFVAAVIFGWRPILVPWLHFESLSFLVTVVVILYTLKLSFGRRAFQRPENWDEFARIAGLGFLLTVCDQGVLFKYLSTLTVGLEPTYLEPVTSTAASLTQAHLLYLCGFCLGNILFTALLLLLVSQIRQLVVQNTSWTFSQFTTKAHTFSRLFLIAILSVSLSFYGLDFALTRPLGYVPNDRALLSGFFAPNTQEDGRLAKYGPPAPDIKDDPMEAGVALTKEQKLAKKRKSIWYNLKPTYPMVRDTDFSSFDRGVFLRRVMGSYIYTYTPETYRLPTAYFWSSRAARSKRFHRYFERVSKAQPSELLPLSRLVKATFAGKEARYRYEKSQQVYQDRLREMNKPQPKMDFLQSSHILQKEGTRQPHEVGLEGEPTYTQFGVHDNPDFYFTDISSIWTNRQHEILKEMKALAIEDVVVNRDRIDQLKAELETFEAPFQTRFRTVANMTSRIFKGQTAPVRKKQKQQMMLWPFQYEYRYQRKQKTVLRHRQIRDLQRENLFTLPLFRADIDMFLKRQPKEQLLTEKDEAELFFKRVMLKNMLYSKEKYRRIYQTNGAMRDAFIDGPKSIGSRVYNHQFNGTYKVVRQLMKTDLSMMWGNPEPNRVLKYDMPLFKDGKDRMTSVHEELFQDLREQSDILASQSTTLTNSFLRQANSRPFYAGWDGDRRAFVLTNRFFPTRVATRAMVLNEQYPIFASERAIEVESDQLFKAPSSNWRKLRPLSDSKKATSSNSIKVIPFTTWPISSKISQDPLLYRTRPGTFMADHPNRHNVRVPSNRYVEDRVPRLNALKSRYLIRHFIPDFDFRPLEILFQEADKPNVTMKKARRNAAIRIAELSSDKKGKKARFVKTERWPTGFIVRHKRRKVWWLEEKPPLPFTDRGGYVWPGHQQLKINMEHYRPQWKGPTLQVKNPFAKTEVTTPQGKK